MVYGLAKDIEEDIWYMMKRVARKTTIGVSIGWKYEGVWYVDDEASFQIEWKNVKKLSRKESNKILGFINNHRYKQ